MQKDTCTRPPADIASKGAKEEEEEEEEEEESDPFLFIVSRM